MGRPSLHNHSHAVAVLVRSAREWTLQLLTHLLHVAKNTEQVSAEHLVNVVGAVATVEEGLGDLRQVGGRIDAGGSGAAHAVEIRAQSDVIDASHFGDVVDVVDEGL